MSRKRAILVTGSCGLVGCATVHRFCEEGFWVVGVDNNMRQYFFGEAASTRPTQKRLEEYPRYLHYEGDIRSYQDMEFLFTRFRVGEDVDFVGIVHTAAQPSHDWAAKEPLTDFDVNARATLILLELARRHCPESPFIYVSTSKVYGDIVNRIPYEEQETRWEFPEIKQMHSPSHVSWYGVRELCQIDQSMHSLFGVSKTAADLLVQEYGRYFQMPTVCFRGGCLTGPYHGSVELHGFLSYLVKCAVRGTPYTIFGYHGKQVRDNIHSEDLANAFLQFFRRPRVGQVYNIGGGRFANVSILEAISLAENTVGRKMKIQYADKSRKGDHIWYISDAAKFRSHYPDWRPRKTIEETIRDIATALVDQGAWE